MLKIKKAGKYLLTLSLALIEITLMMTSECHLGCFTTSINNYSYLILKPSQIAHCRSLIHSLSMEQADFHFLNSVTSETEECVKQTCKHMWGTDVVCHIIGLPTSYKYPTIQRSWPHWYLSPTVGPRLLPVHQGAFCLFLLVCVCVRLCVWWCLSIWLHVFVCVCVLRVSDVTLGQQLNLPRYLSLYLFAGLSVVSLCVVFYSCLTAIRQVCCLRASVCVHVICQCLSPESDI